MTFSRKFRFSVICGGHTLTPLLSIRMQLLPEDVPLHQHTQSRRTITTNLYEGYVLGPTNAQAWGWPARSVRLRDTQQHEVGGDLVLLPFMVLQMRRSFTAGPRVHFISQRMGMTGRRSHLSAVCFPHQKRRTYRMFESGYTELQVLG